MLSAPGYYFCCIKNYLLLDASSCWERSISRSTMMLRKTIIAVVAAASVGMLAPNVALARGGGGGGGGRGGGVHGGCRLRLLGGFPHSWRVCGMAPHRWGFSCKPF